MARSESSPGRPAWRITIPAFVGIAALVVLVGGLGIWSTQTHLAGAIVASGTVEVQSNRQVVQHPDGGVVGEIFVRDGDRVAAGDLLLRFDDTFLVSEKAIVEGQLFELLARKVRLEAERDDATSDALEAGFAELSSREPVPADLIEGQRRLFISRQETLAQKVEHLHQQSLQIEDEIKGTQAQLAALQRQLELIADELADQQSLLSRGLTAASRVSALQREEARLNGEIGQLDATVARLRGEITGTGIEVLNLQSTRREEAITTLRDLQFQEVELAERRLSLTERLSRLDIRAPVAGTIYGSHVFALQSVVQPAEPMMYVVPQDTPLLIVAQVQTIHIDQVFMGQPAALKFQTFNQRQTPELEGHVKTISADVFADEATGLKFYRTELVVNDGQIERLNGQTLLPGMPVEVFIKTDERTPLSYLVKPLSDYFTKAFRG